MTTTRKTAKTEINNSDIEAGESAGNMKLDLEEITRHDKIDDCWLAINGKVYDLSSYLSGHPGGTETIAPHCGREGTAAFQTKGKSRPHSESADYILSGFYIGDLDQAMSSR